MAFSTQVFLYTQRQIVVINAGSEWGAYMPQYSKPLTLHRGVDNRIQFQFLNSNQKPVDITGKSITCRILNATGTEILLSKALTPDIALNGIASLQLNAADIENIPAQKAYYSLEFPIDAFGYPVYIDQSAGARGDMNIVNSVLPSFVPSSNISIPSGQPFPNLSANSNVYTPNANTYYSSVINTSDNPILTIQTTYDQYSGNVVVLGSTQVDSNWYPIDTRTYSNTSETYGTTIVGYHPFVKVQFTSTSGEVVNILSR